MKLVSFTIILSGKRFQRSWETWDIDSSETKNAVVARKVSNINVERSRHVEEEQVLYIFHGPTTTSLTEEIIKERPDLIKRGEISWDKFEDGKQEERFLTLGFPNLFIKDVELIRGRDVVFVASLLQHDELLAQISGFGLNFTFDSWQFSSLFRDISSVR